MQISVECQTRPEGINPRALRRQGLIPASLYGHQGAESISLAINEKDALNLLKKASINNTLIDVNIPHLQWTGKALIREVQSHPWKRFLYHLSFFSIANQSSVQVNVPLKLVGDSIGLKKGGIIEQVISTINVACPPNNIPEFIEVDLTSVDIGGSVHVSELVLPEGITCTDDKDVTILAIIAPKK
jgi:large subunit ribosomal protein L25